MRCRPGRDAVAPAIARERGSRAWHDVCFTALRPSLRRGVLPIGSLRPRTGEIIMKKTDRRLALSRETVRALQRTSLAAVVGGQIKDPNSASSCPTIDGDTCMCRTHAASCTCPPP